MSLIHPDDAWLLWMFLIGWAAVSIVLEQTYKWAAKMTGAVIALLGAALFSNLHIIPKSSPTYDAVWNYIVPISIPLLLFQADVRKIWRESGRIFSAFHVSALGTVIGAFVAAFLFAGVIPHIGKIAGVMTGSYIGGGVNFVALTAAFQTPEAITNAAVVADNFVMAGFFFILIWLSTVQWLTKRYGFTVQNQQHSQGHLNAKAFWKRKDISLKDMSLAVAIAVSVAAVSHKIARFFDQIIPETNPFLEILNLLLGNPYFVITTLMMVLATVFSRFFSNIHGAQEIGTFLIYIFFVVIGVPASLLDILQNSPALFGFCAVIALMNLVVTLGIGKLFRLRLDELLLSANATVGGPTTAAAMAIAKGWTHLVVPVILSGIWGYILGNYAGVLVGNIIGKLLS